MIRSARTDVASSAAAVVADEAEPVVPSAPSAEPAAEQAAEPATEPAAAGDEPLPGSDEVEPAAEPAGTAEAEVETQAETDEGDTGTITRVVAEEPIRLEEPQPARSARSEEKEGDSLRELFWGEE